MDDLITHAALTHPSWCTDHEGYAGGGALFHTGQFDSFVVASDADYAVAVGAHRHDELLGGKVRAGTEYVRLEVDQLQPLGGDPQVWLDAFSARRLAVALLAAADLITEDER